MALKKQLEINDSGVFVDYIRIGESRVIRNSDKLVINCELFLSQQARNEGKRPVAIMEKEVKISEISSSGELIVLLYEELKKMPDFSDAVDV